MNLIKKAQAFAKKKHKGQTYNGREFYNHPKQVAQIIAAIRAQAKDQNLICAAFLHDTIEDTETTFEELKNEFNEDIASLVREVTKDENKNFPYLSTPRGLILKAADRLANCANLVGSEKEEKLLKKYSFCFKNEGTHRKMDNPPIVFPENKPC